MKYSLAIVTICAGIIMGSIVGCSPSRDRVEQNKIAQSIDQGYGEQELVRYEDKEKGVTCYRVRGYEGISCLK